MHRAHLPATGSQVRIANTFGVLRLALEPGAYEWKFIGVSGATLDAGQTAYRQISARTQLPVRSA
jgi:hypothetical protein